MSSTYIIQITSDEPHFFEESLRSRIVRKIFHVKGILVGSKYIINITLKNVGAQVFNGGQLVVSTSWTSSQITVSSYPIKTLVPTESQTVTYCHDALRKD